jgi:RNA polymerase sigma-54 factor
MKFNLTTKQSSKISITPQLQNAIKLLQYSAIEINQEIQNIFESNPLIEKEDACEEYEENSCEEHYSHYKDNPLPNNDNVISTSEVIEKTTSEEDSLKKHLIWQIDLLNISNKDKGIAEAIIDYTNEDGYLIKKIFEIYDDVYSSSEISVDELVAIQHLLQNLDPIGSCCEDIKESLLVQLNNYKAEDYIKSKAFVVISEFFEEYVNKEFNKIEKDLGLDKEEIQKINILIKAQNPRPGSAFISKKQSDYIIPDVKISRENSKWVVKLNKLISPKITINKNYINFSEKNISDNDKVYLKNNLQEAKLFIKNIDYRNNTLIKISNSIFEKQIDFFNKGVEEIKPMNLKEIALSIDVHESTVSRLTNGKYMETPYGIFELKYFFSSSLSNNLGDDLSSKSIKEKIKKIINAENKNKPFSDDKIAYILQNQGINIARRTVAKYRESLNLESSSKRKTK